MNTSETTPVDDLSLNNDHDSDSSKEQTPGHQGGTKTGGTEIYDRVLWCINLNPMFNYGKLFDTFKKYGPIERIKVKMTGRSLLNAFITFTNHQAAKKAKENLDKEENQEMRSTTFSIVSTRNVVDEDSDYIPKVHFEDTPTPTISREPPIPSWYIAHYKEN